jgi:hypothetical protein
MTRPRRSVSAMGQDYLCQQMCGYSELNMCDEIDVAIKVETGKAKLTRGIISSGRLLRTPIRLQTPPGPTVD